MDASSVVLIITSVLTALILGVLITVTLSLLNVSRRLNRRLDDLDDNLVELVTVMSQLSQSSQNELSQLHETLAEQQRVHQSIRATTRLVDILFRKPIVTSAAASKAYSNQRSRRKVRKALKRQKVDV